MPDPITTFSDSSRFTSPVVYYSLRHFVYPPCSKRPDDIRMYHSIETDLGYQGNSKRSLAGKTSRVFGLTAPHRFNGPEMDGLDTVADHHAATCAKLNAAGRLDP